MPWCLKFSSLVAVRKSADFNSTSWFYVHSIAVQSAMCIKFMVLDMDFNITNCVLYRCSSWGIDYGGGAEITCFGLKLRDHQVRHRLRMISACFDGKQVTAFLIRSGDRMG